MGGRGAAGERVRMAAVGGAGFGEGTISRSRNGLGPEFEKKWEMLGRFRKALADLVQVSARKQPIKGPN